MTAPPGAVVLRRLAWGALIVLLLPPAGLAALWLALPDPAGLARANPTTTALIEQRRAEAGAAGRRFQPELRWVPLERISRRLVDAVVASEDATFFTHGGFDWEALHEAFRLNLARGRYARGASTISQQLAKNLYLGTEKSLQRKLREALLTVKLERRLDKRRILALYLNLVEWGGGAFGVEAGARRYFGSGASALTTAQAVVMASMLPAPRWATLSPAPPWLAGRARGLLDRLRDERVIPAEEYAAAAAELERYLGPSPVTGAGPVEEPSAEDPPAGEPPSEAQPAGDPVAEPAREEASTSPPGELPAQGEPVPRAAAGAEPAPGPEAVPAEPGPTAPVPPAGAPEPSRAPP